MSLHGYKFLNHKYNGHYTFTDYRGPYMLYHYTVRRTAPLDKETFWVALTSIPGEKVCRALCGDACKKWWWDSYSLAERKSEELIANGVPEARINSTLIRLAIIEAVKNPFQYAMFMSFEALKLLFWESTLIGYVQYPQWLQYVYNNIAFKNLLRLVVFLITTFAMMSLSKYVWKNRRLLDSYKLEENNRYQQIFFIFYFLVVFILLYSTVITITRYSLPIAPLYLVSIAFIFNEITANRKNVD